MEIVEAAFIEFKSDGTGQFKYICADDAVYVSFNPNSADFDWPNFDEMGEVNHDLRTFRLPLRWTYGRSALDAQIYRVFVASKCR